MLNFQRSLPALLAFALVAATPVTADSVMTVRPGSRLWVDGTSTVKSFTCEAGSFDAQIEANAEAVTAVLGGTKAVHAVNVVVPVSALDCKNDKMNEHMLKALKANEFAEISFRLSSYDLVQAGEAVRATVTGTLTMGGVEKPITFDADVTAGDSGMLEVGGVVDVNMKEFGLKPPSLMLGTMKVREMVKVRFELLLQQ